MNIHPSAAQAVIDKFSSRTIKSWQMQFHVRFVKLQAIKNPAHFLCKADISASPWHHYQDQIKLRDAKNVQVSELAQWQNNDNN